VLEQQQPNDEASLDPGPAFVAVERRDLPVSASFRGVAPPVWMRSKPGFPTMPVIVVRRLAISAGSSGAEVP
jgi:hypothetical protein